MWDFLKSQQQFTYKTEVTDNQVYAGGNKLQHGNLCPAPWPLRVNAEGDLIDKQLFFDSKTITLFDKDDNVYGVLEVPPDIESALDKASKNFGVRVALTDLASPNLCEHIGKRIKHSLYVGLSKVRGVPCHHLSFDSGAAQLQVWVDAGDQPIPRKIMLTHKQLPGSPQWTAYLSDWNFAPPLADDLFVFTPPEGAEKIEFLPVKGAQAQPSGPQKNKGGQE
jgi:hypothetical protein